MSSIINKVQNNIDSILTLKEIEISENIFSMNEIQRSNLMNFSGFGGCQKIFSDCASKSEKEVHSNLKNILDNLEYKSIKNTIIDAHFTPKEFIEIIWKVLIKKGFKGGKVLEPSAGSGRFLTYQPKQVYDQTEWSFSEVDNISGRICSTLHPKATAYLEGFQTLCAIDEEDKFDLVIGNFPFGTTIIYDRKYNLNNENIHNYFLDKSLALTREGGFVVALTSSGLLNSDSNFDFRKKIISNNSLVCSLFLNDRTFPNSEVSCVLVVFQKGINKKYEYNNNLFVDPAGITIGEKKLQINKYFIRNKKCVFGEIIEDKLFGNRVAVKALENEDYSLTIESILSESIADDSFSFSNNFIKSSIDPNVKSFLLKTNQSGEYIYHEDEFYHINNSKVSYVYFNEKDKDLIKNLLQLKIIVLQIFNSEISDKDEYEIDSLRKELNNTYKYLDTMKQLPITTNKIARKLIGDDPYYPMLCALEIEDGLKSKETGKREFIQSDIFYKRTISQLVKPKIVSIDDAVLLSLREKGEIDADYCAELLGIEKNDVISKFNDSEQIFYSPNDNKFIRGLEYLSGDVRVKLKIAKQYGLDKNISALTKIQPKLLLPDTFIDPSVYEKLKEDFSCEIALGENFFLRLGSPVITEETIVTFISELLEVRKSWINLKYDKFSSTYFIKVDSVLKHNVNCSFVYGLDENCNAIDIIESILNSRQLKFYKKTSTGDALDEERTSAARNKCSEMISEFSQWIWKSQERVYYYTYNYNLKYNNIVNANYNGDHLNFPNSSKHYQLRDYQKNAVWRIILNPTTLINHAVGTGKTITMVAAIMELRRLGISKKPMIACLKANRETIGVEFLRMYPFAKVLVPSENDFKKENRVKLFARIATNDWDCVIITHEFLKQIPVDKEILNKCFLDKIDELNDSLLNFASEEKGKITTRIITSIEKSIRSYEEKLKSLYDSDSKDKGLTFEQMGIDALFVDEAQYFKSLEVHTKMQNVKGLATNSASKRASDLAVKIFSLRRSGGRVVFATGTPIMNTMVETYILLKYLYPESLTERDIEHFDAFAGMFIHIENALEIKQTGKFEYVTRAKKFYNLPELLAIFNQFTDSKQISDTNIVLPKSSDIPVIIPPTKSYLDFLEEIAKRAQSCKSNPFSRKFDNFLKIGNDGKLASLDMRLVDSNSPRSVNSKVSQCALQIYHMYKITESFKGVQLVFSDRGTPKPKGIFSVYSELKYLLIELGVKENEIAFIQEIEKDKESFFKKVREGRIRIVIGSTAKLGVGVNVQDLLVAQHHLDMPYRPADYDQRLGRMKRFGNTCSHVFNFIYITQGVKGKNTGFDSWSFQTLKAKKSFIDSFLYNSDTKRESSDINDKPLSHAELMALATGDDLILRKTFLENKLDILRREKRGFEQNQSIIKDKLVESKSICSIYPKRISDLQEYIKNLNCKSEDFCKDKSFVIKISNEIIQDRKDAASAIEKILSNVNKNSSFKFAEFGGLDIFVENDRGERFIKIGSSSHLNNHMFKFNVNEAIENEYLNTNKILNFSLIGRIRKFDFILQSFNEAFIKAQNDINILEKQILSGWSKIDEFNEIKSELKFIEDKYKQSEEELNAVSDSDDDLNETINLNSYEEQQNPDELVEIKMDSEIDSKFVDSDFFFISRLSNYPEPDWVNEASKIYSDKAKKKKKNPARRIDDYDYASLFSEGETA